MASPAVGLLTSKAGDCQFHTEIIATRGQAEFRFIAFPPKIIPLSDIPSAEAMPITFIDPPHNTS